MSDFFNLNLNNNILIFSKILLLIIIKIKSAIKKESKWEELVELPPIKIENNPILKNFIFLDISVFKKGI